MPGTDPLLFWPVALLAAFLVGFAKGGLPVVGMLTVPILSLVMSPVMAAGLLLPVYIVSDVFGVWAYRRAFSRRLLAIMVPATTVGVAAGWAMASIVPERLVTGLVGAIGVVFAVNLLLRRNPNTAARPITVLPGLFWGSLAGFTSFVSHAGAPPYQVYMLPLRLDKAVFAGTTTVLFAYVNALKLVPYYFLGQLNFANLQVAAVLLLPSVGAVFVGVWLVRIIAQELFYRLATWALLLISIKLLWDVATA